MSYPRIVHAVMNSPWAIERSWLGAIFAVLHSRIFGQADVLPPPMAQASAGGMRSGRLSVSRFARDPAGNLINHSARIHQLALAAAGNGEEFDGRKYAQVTQQEEAALPAGQIVHIFGSGIIGKHLSEMEEVCAGGLSIDRIQAALRVARDDPKVSAVMLHLDTPGGVVTGVPETAALVREIAGQKTIAAFSDSLTASAGYWTICGADTIYATTSADLGSIGVYAAVVDYVEWCAKQGIKVDLIKDGAHKGAGYPGTSLTPEQRALIEADVMDLSALFKGAVRASRPGVSDDTMQGQCLRGEHAAAAGLADHIVRDLDEAMKDLASVC